MSNGCTFKTGVVFAILVNASFVLADSFVGYVGTPRAIQSVTNRAFTGIPSLAITGNGRLWATWYAGPTPGEDVNSYVVLTTSGDGGKTWKEKLVADPDETGPRRTFDPQLWIAPDGVLRWFWTDRDKEDHAKQTLWMVTLDDPASETTAWHPPVRVARGVMMGKPIVLSTGEWALPVAAWFQERSSGMVVSTDGGKTWSLRGGATMPKEARLFDEHSFVERRDGSLWVLARTKFGIAESVSMDRGATWVPMYPSWLQHTSARFFLRRLNSGNVLLVKHGPLYKDVGRSQLTAYLSNDDGATWTGGLMLDARPGVSYPDGQQTADGRICVIYDHDRTGARQILLATFREEDVLSGKTSSPSVNLRRLVSQGTGGKRKASK
jgi:hypothetical protein